MAGCLFNIISQGIVSILQSHPKLLLRVFDGMCVPSGLPMWLSGKESACNTGDMGSTHESGRFPGVGNETTPFWPGKSQGQRSLVGHSPWGHKESDMTEWLSMHTCGPFIFFHKLQVLVFLSSVESVQNCPILRHNSPQISYISVQLGINSQFAQAYQKENNSILRDSQG